MKTKTDLTPKHPIGSLIMNYIVGPKIGQGAFGEIYSAIDQYTGLIWAIKTEPNSVKRKTLAFEYQILARVQSSPTFPRLGILGHGKDFSFISMELLGPSLANILKKLPKKTFTFSTGIRASYFILKCIESLHVFGFIHRDIKPGNILTREGSEHPLCLIDFGLSRMYIDQNTGKHFTRRPKIGFRGTRAYASVHAHLSQDLSRRDDLISWFYLTYEFAIGPLPWRHLGNKHEILRIKENFDVETQVSEIAPELIDVWNYVKSLKFEETPNYSRIYDSILRICRREGFKLDDPFDWSEMLHKSSNKMAKAVEGLKPNSHLKKAKCTESSLQEKLLHASITIPPPFSHVSEESGCCGC
ncbi:CK1 family protein kinase [Histomonas meleagridis]|uniref:CK1 family protein kinase n=1 Tax=Histomonas meleagridis TaxID=135588 RepID=UPI00355ABF0D|nr:CK1 family protein kinase [Histomonas meleagridis]KAH0797742.1 CK1 family protein kinase [Histomonas meleagridis]